MGRAPARRLEPHLELVPPARRAPGLARKVGVDLDIGPDRIPGIEGRACPVHAALGLGRETAEQPVPDDQDSAVVPVDVPVVDRVMHAMIRRGRKDTVDPAQPADVLGVDPVLIEQVDQGRRREYLRREADHRHRQVEQPSKQSAAAGLPQRRREIELLALVMDDVRRPEDGALVPDPVMPVVAEVVHDDARHPYPPGLGRQFPHRELGPCERIETDSQELREEVRELAQDTETQAVHGVIQAVGVAAAKATPGVLESDQGEEERRRDGNGTAHGVYGCSRSQPRARSTARDQRVMCAAAASRVIAGSNCRSARQLAASSAVDRHRPTERPARFAAPCAVVSTFDGRTTGIPSRSAWNWSRRSLRAAPPSTRSSRTGDRASACIADSSSALWNAIDSSAARATWARVVPRDKPRMAPRAYGSQWGLPRPVKAGTRHTPPASGTLAARASTSEDDLMIESPSRSHCTTAPPVNTEPSSA